MPNQHHLTGAEAMVRMLQSKILPGVVEANGSSIPVLAITSDVATTSAGRYPLTELDQARDGLAEDFSEEPSPIADDSVPVPDRPGFGIGPDVETLAALSRGMDRVA